MNFYKDERWPKMIGLFLIFISLYLLIAFTSYLFTWKQDWDKAYWGHPASSARDEQLARAFGGGAFS